MIQFEFVLTLVMVSILIAGDVVSMGHLSYSLAVIPTPKSMIRCDAPSMVSLDSHSSGYYDLSLEIDRFCHGGVIDPQLDVSKLRQIFQNQIWDPGSSNIDIGKDGMISRSDHKQKVYLMFRMTTYVYSFRIVTSGACRSTQGVCVDRHKSGTIAISADVVFIVSAKLWVAEVQRIRIKRSNHHHVRVYGTITRHNTSRRFSFLFQREADVLTMTSKSRQQLKVMLKAFWSFSYMLLAINLKYMKGGPISHSLIARKAYVQQAGLTHSIIEATASHICEKRLYPSSLSLLSERICVSNLVYPNDVLFCY